MRGVNSYGCGQSGIFRVYGGDSTEVLNKVRANDWVGYTSYDPTTALRNEIKNLGIHGTAVGRKNSQSILLQCCWDTTSKGRGYVYDNFEDTYMATTNGQQYEIAWNTHSHHGNTNNGFRAPNHFTVNLLIKNIFFTRTRATCFGRESLNQGSYNTATRHQYKDAVPYIVPPYFPGPMGYLSVENIYVKLDYSMNSLGGIAGSTVGNNQFYFSGTPGAAARRKFILVFSKTVYLIIMDINQVLATLYIELIPALIPTQVIGCIMGGFLS